MVLALCQAERGSRNLGEELPSSFDAVAYLRLLSRGRSSKVGDSMWWSEEKGRMGGSVPSSSRAGRGD